MSVYRHKAKNLFAPSEPHICLDGHSIEGVNSYKCLGVQVDEKLSWEAHISEVIGKVAKILTDLRGLRRICHQSTLLTIYKSLVLPHLDYCSAVWGCIGNGLSQKTGETAKQGCTHNYRVQLGCQICPDSSCP